MSFPESNLQIQILIYFRQLFLRAVTELLLTKSTESFPASVANPLCSKVSSCSENHAGNIIELHSARPEHLNALRSAKQLSIRQGLWHHCRSGHNASAGRPWETARAREAVPQDAETGVGDGYLQVAGAYCAASDGHTHVAGCAELVGSVCR